MDVELFISEVTLYELQMGATDATKVRDVQLLTESIPVLPLTKDVALKAAEIYHDLRRRNQMIEFRDIFIGATAIIAELPVLTKNKKHFKRIANLTLAAY
ncbi:MAG: type II toxin-antitoxin system VapC family toxin [Bacteroidota bacterium]